MKTKKLLISYDITSDKKRKQISDLLSKEGTRIQYSVFECSVSLKKLNHLKKMIEKIINGKTDSVLIYFLCDLCEGKKEILGKEYIIKIEKFYISR